jgi:hypothetical protein
MSVRQTDFIKWGKLVEGAGDISPDPGVMGDRFMASRSLLMLS